MDIWWQALAVWLGVTSVVDSPIMVQNIRDINLLILLFFIVLPVIFFNEYPDPKICNFSDFILKWNNLNEIIQISSQYYCNN